MTPLDRRDMVQGEERNTSPWQQATRTSTTSSNEPAPAYRHTTKKPLTDTRPMGSTGIPHPRDTPATSDYLIREGNLWKRVHVQPRWDWYIPQQTHYGPDVTRLIPARTTFVRPTDGSRYYRIDDDWTTKRQATLNMEWTGSTNFEENNTYEDEFILDDPEEAQEAKRATGIPAPQQPTEQDRREHELTHVPYTN